MDIKIDEDFCSPADYTIMVRNIPTGLNVNYKDALEDVFTYHAVPNKKLNPVSITLIYNLDYISNLWDLLD